MVARARNPLIVMAAGLLAGCLGVALPASADTPSDGSSVLSWFNRGGSNSSNPAPAPKPAPKPDAPGPIDKISAGFSNMSQSVKKTFTRSGQKNTSTHPRPKTEDDAISLNKPAKPGADFFISLARYQENAGNQDAAIEQYKHALEVEPDSLAALLAMARVYDRQGNLPEAMKYYKKAVTSHPNQASAHNDQGLCFARQEQYPESVACLQKAVELAPDRALYRNNLATVQVETGQLDKALKTLSAVHSEAVAHYNVGYLLNRRHRTSEALQQFQLAVAKDPNFEAARQWVDVLSSKLANQHADEPVVKPAEPPASHSLAETKGVAESVDSPSAKSGETVAPRSAVAKFITPAAKPAASAARPSKVVAAVAPPAKAADSASPPAAATFVTAPTKSAVSTDTLDAEVTVAAPPAEAVAPKFDDNVAASAPPQNPVAVAFDNAPALPASPPQVPSANIPSTNVPGTSVAANLQAEAPAASIPGDAAASDAAVAVAPEPSPTTKPAPVVSGIAPSKSDPPKMAQSKFADGENDKPRYRENLRSESAAALNQRLTRLPPTPDQIDDYSRAASGVDVTRRIVPLPPVDPEHYPAGRY